MRTILPGRTLKARQLKDGEHMTAGELAEAERMRRMRWKEHPLVKEGAAMMRQGKAVDAFIDREFGIPEAGDFDALQERGMILRAILDVVTNDGQLKPPHTKRPRVMGGAHTQVLSYDIAAVREHIRTRRIEDPDVSVAQLWRECTGKHGYPSSVGAFYNIVARVVRQMHVQEAA